MRSLQEKYHFTDEEFAFMGDELFDMPLLNVVGFAAAPKNARPEVQRIVQYVTRVAGGDGAVREVIDLILEHQQRPRS
jgi:3-deoxy-D-manno-octulosonate 8-phosphate phosphatase (KDO 8-P phosphatase)